MKKVNIKVTAKSLKNNYNIEMDEKFSEVFEKDWETLTRGERSIDERDLLYAYMQKCYENFLQNKELDELNKKLDTLKQELENLMLERRKNDQNKAKT